MQPPQTSLEEPGLSSPSAIALATPDKGTCCGQRRDRCSLWLSLILMFGLAGPMGPAAAAVWIEFYDGKPDDYRFHRQGERLPVAIYKDLHKDDRISVTKPGLSLWLKRDDNTDMVVTLSNSPYWVQDAGKAPSVLDQLLAFAGEYLSLGLEDGSASPRVVTVGSRGDDPAPAIPLRFPLVPSRTARLAEGPRPLHLYWLGGAPPVRVRLLRDGATEPLLELTLNGLAGNSVRRLALPPSELKAGNHVLELRDVRRRKTIRLEVVPEEAMPKPPQGLGPDEQDPLRANLYAVWLASQGEEWMLEAYQRAREIADQHPPARAFGYSLEAGRRPIRPGAVPEQAD